MIGFLSWLLWVVGVRYQPVPVLHSCPDFVDPEDDLEFLDDPDAITNARWYAEHCYSLPTAKR